MRRLVAALLLVGAGWLASPAAVPVYDGVGSPDDPYRYVGKSPAPSTASVSAPLSGGTSGSLQLKTAENGPQLLVDLGAGAFRGTGSSLTLTGTPLPPDGTPPRGSIDGNVYRVSARGGRLDLDTTQGFLFLRAAVMTRPDPVVVHRDGPGAPWQEVKTTLAGRDILSTPFRALGDYAVVRLPGAKPLSDSGLSLTRVLLLGGGVLLLLVVTVLVLRRPGSQQD
ncbi:MAG: hypothetical protein WCD35_03575 [Mycobacteriales bacterium]